MLWLYGFPIVIFILYWYWPARRTTLPGPPCWPIIGSIPSILLADAKRPSIAFKKLGEKYGPIFSLRLGATPVVVVNGHKELMELSHSDDLLARTGTDDFWLLEKSDSLPIGLAFSMPEFWSRTRHFTEKSLRKFGFPGKENIVQLILEEMTDFCDELSKDMINDETTLKIKTQFDPLFSNITWTLLTGQKYSINNKETQNIQNYMNSYLKSTQYGGGIAILFPKLVRAFPNVTGFTKIKKLCIQWRESLKNFIDTIRLSTTESGETDPQNFIEDFLLKIDNTPPPKHILDSIYTQKNLEVIVQDLVMGGTDTLSCLTNFFVRVLVQKPTFQQKLQDEVDDVVGRDSSVSMQDLDRLIYSKASLYELLRLMSVVDISQRKLLTDVQFREYTIPKGTLLILNQLTGNTDPMVWSNPEEFNPNRFLSPDGTLINIEKIVSFGFGKRKCIGDQVAKTAMLLMMVTLIQQFTFHVDPSFGMPTNEAVHGLLRNTTPFTIKIKKRI